MHKKPLWMLVALSLTVGLTACGSDDDDDVPQPPEGESFIRVVHASPDAPAVDIIVDGKTALRGVGYLDASDYLEVAEGEHEISIVPSGGTAAVLTTTVELGDGDFYTAVAVGYVAAEGEDFDVLLLTDDATPDDDSFAARVVHAAPSVPEVDVYVVPGGTELEDATPVLVGVAFGDVSDYLPVEAGDYDVAVTLSDETEAAIGPVSISPEAGQALTFIAVEAEGGGAPFDVLALEDNTSE